MKAGDVILTIPNGFKVTFKGYIAGRINSYVIKSLIIPNRFEVYKGTTEELLKHCAEKVKKHNENVKQHGGIFI